MTTPAMDDNPICRDRVAIVTGGGRGIGRAHAIELARQGAAVIVNDIGCELDGTGGGSGPAGEVVELIRGFGGTAVANGSDIADWGEAQALVDQAVETFGELHAVVNNAGIVRDRMFMNIEESEWDEVMRVHLKGHLAVSRFAANRWRASAKGGTPVSARIVNTSSGAGIYGSVGQSAYATAKAGIAVLTINQAAELARYGVTANAIAPAARTRMTEGPFAEQMAKPDDPSAFDAMDPANISPLVAWLVSAESSSMNGRLFEIEGGRLSIATGWTPGPSRDNHARWDVHELGFVIESLASEAPAPTPVNGA